MAQPDQRAHGQAALKWLVGFELQIDYQAIRPMRALQSYPYEQMLASALYAGKHIAPDCSEFVTLVYKYAGLRDPTGQSYSGYGNSQSMYDNLAHYYDPKRAGALAIVEYKVNGVSRHVNLVYEPDPVDGNPTLVNHGSPSGPQFVDFRTFTKAWEPAYVPTFLNVGGL